MLLDIKFQAIIRPRAILTLPPNQGHHKHQPGPIASKITTPNDGFHKRLEIRFNSLAWLCTLLLEVTQTTIISCIIEIMSNDHWSLCCFYLQLASQECRNKDGARCRAVLTINWTCIVPSFSFRTDFHGRGLEGFVLLGNQCALVIWVWEFSVNLIVIFECHCNDGSFKVAPRKHLESNVEHFLLSSVNLEFGLIFTFSLSFLIKLSLGWKWGYIGYISSL